MDIDWKVLSNPYVIGGGVLIGLVILMTSNKAEAGVSSTSASDIAYAINNQGAGVQTANAQIAAGLQSQAMDNNLQVQLRAFSFLENQQQVSAMTQISNHQTSLSIQAQRSKDMQDFIVDLQSNNIRQAQSYLAANVATAQTAAEVKIASIMADAQKYAAKKAAKASEIGSIVGGVGSIVGGALKFAK